MIGRRLAPAGLLHAFSLVHPEVVLDVVTLEDAVPALREGASTRASAPSPRRSRDSRTSASTTSPSNS